MPRPDFASILKKQKNRCDTGAEREEVYDRGRGRKAEKGATQKKAPRRRSSMEAEGHDSQKITPVSKILIGRFVLLIALMYTIIPEFIYPNIHFLGFFCIFLLSYRYSGIIMHRIVVFLKKFELVCD